MLLCLAGNPSCNAVKRSCSSDVSNSVFSAVREATGRREAAHGRAVRAWLGPGTPGGWGTSRVLYQGKTGIMLKYSS